MSLSFCTECRKMVECKIEKKKITEYLKGCYYTYNGEIATCNKCGAEVYIPEILDGNMDKRNNCSIATILQAPHNP